MRNFKYFTLKELCYSKVAEDKKIDNFPSFDVVEHLSELTEKILDPLREAWGSGIRVNSGYRCDTLNNAVKGVKTSVHRLGWAADLYPSNGKYKEFVLFVKDWVVKNRIRFDQIIEESAGSDKWLHIGLYSTTGSQRGQIFNIDK